MKPAIIWVRLELRVEFRSEHNSKLSLINTNSPCDTIGNQKNKMVTSNYGPEIVHQIHIHNSNVLVLSLFTNKDDILYTSHAKHMESNSKHFN